MAADTNQAFGTAATGAMAGASIGGPVGGIIGGVAGLGIGLFGSSKQGYSIPWDKYQERLNQISSYSQSLDAATNSYANAIGNMYNTAYNQYLPNAAAVFAGRGFGINSGAFASELAKTAAGYTANQNADVARQRIANVNNVSSLYGSAWDSIFGAAVGSSKAGWDNYNTGQRAYGSLATSVGMEGLRRRREDRNNTTNTANPWSYSGSGGSDYNASSPTSGASEGWR